MVLGTMASHARGRSGFAGKIDDCLAEGWDISTNGGQSDLAVDEIVNDRAQGMRRDLEGRQRYRQLEPPPARAARV
jgi:hypothetical protein